MKRKIFLVELSEGKITEKTDRYGKDQKIPLTLESPPKAPQPQFPEKEGSVTDQKLFWNNSRQYLEAAIGAWAGVGSYPAWQRFPSLSAWKRIALALNWLKLVKTSNFNIFVLGCGRRLMKRSRGSEKKENESRRGNTWEVFSIDWSLHASQVAHQAGAYPGFHSMKRPGVFIMVGC